MRLAVEHESAGTLLGPSAVVSMQHHPSKYLCAYVLNHVRVNLDQIRTLTGELAARFGVQPPHIELGNVPEWCLDGVRPQLRKGQAVVMVGSAFNDYLSLAEQEGALAEAVVILDSLKSGRRFLVASRLLLGAAAIILSGIGGWFAAVYDMPWWPVAPVVLVPYAIARYLVVVVRFRRALYQMDRRVAEVMGRPLIDLMLNLDGRVRSQLRGPVGILVKMSTPSEAERAKRLNTRNRGPEVRSHGSSLP
ncbi:hypothetical protein AB0C34_07565 [Nocardia sp. NPDC049220]|uniref:hypothetical protein n=1 Tax=Nocardia sp. NPDC049220 TaxID=3155273 RepID=UPI0033D135E2